MSRDIRAKALQKIASLSATSSVVSFDRSDLDRLCRACHAGAKGREYANGAQNSKSMGSLGRIPMVRRFSYYLFYGLTILAVHPRIRGSSCSVQSRAGHTVQPECSEALISTSSLYA